jgi:hypothetical protein
MCFEIHSNYMYRMVESMEAHDMEEPTEVHVSPLFTSHCKLVFISHYIKSCIYCSFVLYVDIFTVKCMVQV